MTLFTEENMENADHWFCLPLVMLINFALFQYLCVMYFRRRNEYRIALLLVCAFLGFSAIIPQAHPRKEMVGHLNDISETCSMLTFLIQIIVIGRDIERKVKIASLKILTYGAELLTVAGVVTVVLNFVTVFGPSVDTSAFDGLDNIVEITSLFYIFFFRFFFIAMPRGWKWMLDNKKLEIFLYFLFITHELPFPPLTNATGVSWEPVQSIWHRLTLMMCIIMTVKDKLSSKRHKSKEGASTAAFSKGPSFGVANKNGEDDDDEEDTTAGHGDSKRKTTNFRVRPVGFSDKASKTNAKAPSSASTAASSGLFSIRGRSLSRSTAKVLGVAPGPSKPSTPSH